MGAGALTVDALKAGAGGLAWAVPVFPLAEVKNTNLPGSLASFHISGRCLCPFVCAAANT